MALTVTKPVAAIGNFFIAVVMVIIATYLLFNAGSITLLKFLKKRKGYYYKTQNFISVSNLISRMRKNAAGLATISILSTMLLVTLVGTINIYVGGQDYITTLHPKDYNVSVVLPKSTDQKEALLDKVQQVAQDTGLKKPSYTTYLYQSAFIMKLAGNDVTVPMQRELESDTSILTKSAGTITVINRQDYEKMTGEKIDLADDETLVYGKNISLNKDKPLRVNGKDWKIKQLLSSNFTHGEIPNPNDVTMEQGLYMVVNDSKEVNLDVDHYYYIGVASETKNSKKFVEQVQLGLRDTLDQEQAQDGSFAMASDRYSAEKSYQELTGTLLFIGVFLSVIFLLGAVLVIYYKQISEGYEDRDGFIILQKVGLDEKQTRSTIRKQILTVFFLPLIFAFLHVAAVFHMLRLIVALLGVTNLPLLIQTTLATCGVFLLTYILVFLLTSRSYRKIVAR